MKPKKLHILIFHRIKKGQKILEKCPPLCAQLQSRCLTWRDLTSLTCPAGDEARGDREDGSVRGRVRHSNLAEGQTTPPTPQQLWAGLAPGEDPPSSLAVLAPEMPSTLSLTKKPITAAFSVCGQGSGPGHSLASGLCMILEQQTRGSQLLTQALAL